MILHCKFLTGFSNTISRFLSGWVAKLPYMTSIRVNNIGLSVAGVATILAAFSTTHTHLIIYCIVWGGFIGLIFQLNLFNQTIHLFYFSISCFNESSYCL